MGVGRFAVIDEIGVIEIDSPPVNALGAAVREALHTGLTKFLDDQAVRAIVMICAGRTFFAGADITEFGKPIKGPNLLQIFDTIEGGSKPVIAAIHGTALGGGYELALTCHYRIAVPSAKVGLPEVKLGLLPGAGGTQRLPRIVGVEAALDLITSGRPVAAPDAFEIGMIDALAADGRLKEDAVAFARALLAEGKPLTRVRDRQEKVESVRSKLEIFAEFRQKNARAFRGFKAPENIIKSIEAAVEMPFEEGIVREHELFLELEASTESRAQRYEFFAEREAAKIPDIGPDTRTLTVAKVGVIGAGTMGGGIAMNFLNAGLPVTLVETNQEALDRGVATIMRNYEASSRKGRMTSSQVKERMALITPTLDFDALGTCDLVIEAVFEEMAIKKEVFARLDKVAKAGAILASNTSFLDLDDIASATSRPEWVIGLHFFSPANVMRLLEVVRGAKTSKEVIATAMKLAKTIGKVPVLSRVGYGFIANRVMAPRSRQAEQLVLEGPSPQEIDQAIYDYGFAMGPFQMADLVGLDVIGRDSDIRSLRGDLVKKGRLGQKKNGGFYDYDERRKPVPSSAAAEVIADFARFRDVIHRGRQSTEDILSRLLYPVVNEGARVLEEGIAQRASDIDLACILGYNWPIYTGGPMFWADTVGLPKIVERLDILHRELGDPSLKPARLLRDLAAQNKTFTQG